MSFSDFRPQVFCGLVNFQCFSVAYRCRIEFNAVKNIVCKWAAPLPYDTFATSSRPLILEKFSSPQRRYT